MFNQRMKKFSENRNYKDMANAVIRKLSAPDVGGLEEADDMAYSSVGCGGVTPLVH